MIRRNPTVAALALLLVPLSALSPIATAQDDPPAPETIVPTPQTKAPPSSVSGTLGEVFEQIRAQEPIRRAGLRASVLRRAQLVIPALVIVHDAESYLYAIANWEGGLRYPVLFDDGTVASREDIARFVRAFGPEQVFELSNHDYAWGGDREAKKGVFETVLSRALDEKAPSSKASLDKLEGEGVVSPGIVVTDADDDAWAAALALAAGRVQPVVFVENSLAVHRPMSAPDADALEREIEHGAKLSGRSWDGIGDDIDAITLALNTGTMIETGGGARDRLATSDRIGRTEANGAGTRWAWCGQIIGGESRAVYQAMCALFLTIDQGFVWDGYGSGQPWAQYDGAQAGEVLKEAGLEVEINDEPRNGLSDWKLRMVRPVGAPIHDAEHEGGSSTLMLVNSSGNSNFFELPASDRGQGRAGHIPVLGVPAAMHIVHSFSLQRPLQRNTIGGRLLERGVYVYAGSVDEPYLQGFVPTPGVARRLAGVLAFAAAVHFDDAQPWKIAVLGDPLVTFGPAGRRIEGELNINGADDLDDRSKQRLKDGDYLGAIRDLALLGRDEAVSRLMIALMKDKPGAVGPGVALAAIPSMFRSGEYTSIVDAYERLDASERADDLMRDILWLASPYLMARASSDAELQLRLEAILRANIREGQKVQDAEDLAMHMRRHSIEGAIGVLESLRPTLRENEINALDAAIDRVRR